MLVIEMVSDSDVFKFNAGQSVSVYINDSQIVTIRIAKLINKKNFYMLINNAKVLIREVKVVYIG